MVVGISPPRHRHDGTSPLPLGMDASPAPSRWIGVSTTWPHDPRTGWSYCVMIPSWVVLPEAKATDGSFVNPTVFYHVQVGIQSMHGVSSMRTILRRFSDFLKLFTALKQSFPRKHLPTHPPKNSFLWINSSQSNLEERRHALGDWMAKLLTDIDISRSAPMASFLELEAAAREAMNVVSGPQPSTSSSNPRSNSTLSWAGVSSSVTSGGSSVAENESDTIFETLELGTPKKTSEKGFEVGMENQVVVQQAIAGRTGIENCMEYTGDMVEGHVLGVDSNAIDNKSSLLVKDAKENSPRVGDSLDDCSKAVISSELTQDSSAFKTRAGHVRRSSGDSIVSEMSSTKGSEVSVAATGDGLVDFPSWSEGGNEGSMESLPCFDTEAMKGIQVALPRYQQRKVRRLLLNLQRRIITAKADMEDLITRLNQEVAVKEFLATKVRDLEGELDNTRWKSREVLQQAVSMEHENLTNLQWELEECRVALTTVDEQARVEKEARIQAEGRLQITDFEKKKVEDELAEMRERFQCLQKDMEKMEAKAKADIRVLAKEIKSLRETEPELRKELELALAAKAELEAAVNKERQWPEQQRTFRTKFLHEVKTLRQRLQECSVDVLGKENNSVSKNPAVSDPINLLMTSDNRIGLLLAEAQLLAEERAIGNPLGKSQLPNGLHDNSTMVNSVLDQETGGEEELRKMLIEIFMDNAQLRKAVNSLTRNALVMASKWEKSGVDEVPIRKSVLNRFL
eukprot:c27831_g1_i2 orf=759-2978(-)